MLNFYRKNIKLFIWVIVLSFVAWGVGTLSLSKESASPYVGSIRGEKISHKEFLTTLRYYDLFTRQQARSAAAEESKQESKEKPKEESKAAPVSYDEIRGLAWQTILLSREAKRKGIAVGNEDVRTEVERLFSINGEFQDAFYQSWIQNQFRGRARDFEEVVRKDVAARKLREQVLEGVEEEKRQGKWLTHLLQLMKESELKEFKTEPDNHK